MFSASPHLQCLTPQTHAGVPPDRRKKLGIDAGLPRFSVGIENAAELIADVTQALDR